MKIKSLSAPGSRNPAPSPQDRMVPEALWLVRINVSSGCSWLCLQLQYFSIFFKTKFQVWNKRAHRSTETFAIKYATNEVGHLALQKLLKDFQLEDETLDAAFGQDELSPRQVQIDTTAQCMVVPAYLDVFLT